MSCRKCGRCCEAIMLSATPRQVKELADEGNTDAQFIRRNWRPLTEERALIINPFLAKWAVGQFLSFYTCRLFDPVSRTCAVHSIRPTVCRGFPFYGQRRPMTLYSSNCGYAAESKRYRRELDRALGRVVDEEDKAVV